MKTKFLLILGAIILSLAVYGYFKSVPGAEENVARPQIGVSPQDFDFGQIQYGQTVKYAFSVKNTGEALLEIDRVGTSCSCTKAEIAKTKLNPGEETSVLVTYDSGAMSGDHAKGLQERIIYIRSTDPVNPQVEVTLHADVK